MTNHVTRWKQRSRKQAPEFSSKQVESGTRLRILPVVSPLTIAHRQMHVSCMEGDRRCRFRINQVGRETGSFGCRDMTVIVLSAHSVSIEVVLVIRYPGDDNLGEQKRRTVRNVTTSASVRRCCSLPSIFQVLLFFSHRVPSPTRQSNINGVKKRSLLDTRVLTSKLPGVENSEDGPKKQSP